MLSAAAVFGGGGQFCIQSVNAISMIIFLHASYGITKNLFRASEAFARRRTYTSHITNAVRKYHPRGTAAYLTDDHEAQFLREFETFGLSSQSDAEMDELTSTRLLTDVTQWWFLRQFLLRMSDISLTYYSPVVSILFFAVLGINTAEIVAIFQLCVSPAPSCQPCSPLASATTVPQVISRPVANSPNMQIHGPYILAFLCGLVVYIALFCILFQAASANHKQTGHATLVCEAAQSLGHELLLKKDDTVHYDSAQLMSTEEKVHELLRDISRTIQTEGTLLICVNI